MSERKTKTIGRVKHGVVVPAAHTPGPWRACYSSTDEFPGGNIRSDNHADGTGALLFTTGTMFHDYTPDRGEEIANLRLAAAAPALLEALRTAESVLMGALFEVRSAIITATGEEAE